MCVCFLWFKKKKENGVEPARQTDHTSLVHSFSVPFFASSFYSSSFSFSFYLLVWAYKSSDNIHMYFIYAFNLQLEVVVYQTLFFKNKPNPIKTLTYLSMLSIRMYCIVQCLYMFVFIYGLYEIQLN